MDESGCSICGGLDTCGRAWACVRRSATTCRALKRFVPGSKTRRIRDSPGTDCERMSSRNATPFSRSCSIGTVISCSTSAAESPRASVWTSTVGGTNSGRTSTGIWRSRDAPTTIVAAARATTSKRNLRLDSMIHLVIGRPPRSAPSPSALPLRLPFIALVNLRGADWYPGPGAYPAPTTRDGSTRRRSTRSQAAERPCGGTRLDRPQSCGHAAAVARPAPPVIRLAAHVHTPQAAPQKGHERVVLKGTRLPTV